MLFNLNVNLDNCYCNHIKTITPTLVSDCAHNDLHGTPTSSKQQNDQREFYAPFTHHTHTYTNRLATLFSASGKVCGLGRHHITNCTNALFSFHFMDSNHS